jgi:branched-chain amino acid transport system permease protein
MFIAQAMIDGLLQGGVYALMALGLSLVLGVLRIINLAHGNLVLIGMYTSYYLFALFGIDPYVSMLASAVVGFLLGYIIQWLVLNPITGAPEEMAVLVTLAIGLIIQNLLLTVCGTDYYTVDTSYRLETIMFQGLRVDLPKLLAFLSSLIIVGGFFLFMEKTDIGRTIRAATDNREAALLMGVNVRRIYCLAFGVGTVLATLAGSSISTFIPTSQDAGVLFTMASFVIVIAGGIGSHKGLLLGGLLVGVLEEMGTLLFSGSLKQVMSLGLLVIILLVRPQGLFGKEA